MNNIKMTPDLRPNLYNYMKEHFPKFNPTISDWMAILDEWDYYLENFWDASEPIEATMDVLPIACYEAENKLRPNGPKPILFSMLGY